MEFELAELHKGLTR